MAFGPAPIGPGTASADSTGLLSPVADGTYQQWTLVNGGGDHYDNMDEAPDCSDGDNDYVYATGSVSRESFTVDISGIPNGATITSVDVSVCYRSSRSNCTDGLFQTFARLDGTNTDSGADIPADSTTKASTVQNVNVADTVKAGSTAVEIGIVRTGSDCYSRAYAVGAVVNYDTSPTFSDIFGTVWEDLNGDGDQDSVAGGNPIDEPAFSGVTIELYDNPGCTGSPVATTPTAGDGGYSFLSLASGTYCVLADAATLSPSAEYYNTTQNNPQTVTLPSGGGDIDFGFASTCFGTIDFSVDAAGNPLLAGAVLREQWAPWGIHITTDGPLADFGDTHPAIVYDADCLTPYCSGGSCYPDGCSGGDPDLGTPNQAFCRDGTGFLATEPVCTAGPGPGVGGGDHGGPGPGANWRSLDNIMIVANDVVDNYQNGTLSGPSDGRIDNPNDRAGDGVIIITFDYPVCIGQVPVLDIDENIDSVIAYDAVTGGNVLGQRPTSWLGDNSYQIVSVCTCDSDTGADVRRLEVNFEGSGAVAAIISCCEDCSTSLGNYVWDDTAAGGGIGDGVQALVGEPGMRNVEVQLFEPSDPVNPFMTTYTDNVGFYIFRNLVPNAPYFVKVIPPPDWAVTLQDTGSGGDPNANDSDIDSNGLMATTTVPAGKYDDTWDAGLYQSPTAVELLSLSALRDGDAVRLEWETVTEVDTRGFHVHRAGSATGSQQQLTVDLVASGQPPGSLSGATYSYLDEATDDGTSYFYWIEEVDIHGVATKHGPVWAAGAGPGEQASAADAADPGAGSAQVQSPLPDAPAEPPPVVPEASTLLLLGSGLSGLAGYAVLHLGARRRR